MDKVIKYGNLKWGLNTASPLKEVSSDIYGSISSGHFDEGQFEMIFFKLSLTGVQDEQKFLNQLQ